MKAGYLLSQYPTVAHTYLLREIRALRALGWDILTVSVRPPDRAPDRLTDVESEEWKSTFYVLGGGAGPVVADQIRVLLTRPGGYLRGLFCAIRLGGFDLTKDTRT